MSRPGFRRSSRQAAPNAGTGRGLGGPQGQPQVGGAPFSQAQILHLMKSEFGRARRHEYPLSCVILAVDRIRTLEEVHGPRVASELRQALGRVVAEQTREHDHLGLLNEDRLMVLLPHTDGESSGIVAERIRQAFEEIEIENGPSRVGATVSIGIASCEDRDTLFFDTLVSQAEVALDWAVRDGGSRVQLFKRDRFVDLNDR